MNDTDPEQNANRKSRSDYDEHDVECDLGLGDGLKPGSYYDIKMEANQNRLSRKDQREDSYSDSDVAPDLNTKTNRFVQRLNRRQKGRRFHNKRNSVENEISSGSVLDDIEKLSISPDLNTKEWERRMSGGTKCGENGILHQSSSIKEFKGNQ